MTLISQLALWARVSGLTLGLKTYVIYCLPSDMEQARTHQLFCNWNVRFAHLVGKYIHQSAHRIVLGFVHCFVLVTAFRGLGPRNKPQLSVRLHNELLSLRRCNWRVSRAELGRLWKRSRSCFYLKMILLKTTKEINKTRFTSLGYGASTLHIWNIGHIAYIEYLRWQNLHLWSIMVND